MQFTYFSQTPVPFVWTELSTLATKCRLPAQVSTFFVCFYCRIAKLYNEVLRYKKEILGLRYLEIKQREEQIKKVVNISSPTGHVSSLLYKH